MTLKVCVFTAASYPDGGTFRTSGRYFVRLLLMEAMNARDIPNGEGVVYNEAKPIYWHITLRHYGRCANILALRVQSVNRCSVFSILGHVTLIKIL